MRLFAAAVALLALLGTPASGQRLLPSANSDSAAGGRARAIARLLEPGGAEEGAAAYVRGAGGGGSDDAYLADALPLASSAERASWPAAAGARADWVRDFWTRHAAEAGESVAERLVQHFQRLAVAGRDYRARSQRGAPPEGAIRLVGHDSAIPYEDRGLVYIRYGRPDGIIVSHVPGARPHELWAYQGVGSAPRTFLFVAVPSAPGMWLTEDALQLVVPGQFDITRRMEVTRAAKYAGTPFDDAVAVLADLAPADPLIQRFYQRVQHARAVFSTKRCQYAGSCERPSTYATDADVNEEFYQAVMRPYLAAREDYTAAARTAGLAALEAEEGAPHFDRPLPFYYDRATFRGRDGLTDVIAPIAVPAAMLPSVGLADGRIAFSPRVIFSVSDAAAVRAAVTDTVIRVASSRRLGPRDYLRLVVAVAAQPSTHARHRIVVRAENDPMLGQLYSRPDTVPDYRGSAFMMSDLVLAAGEEGGTWRRGAALLSFIPPRQFPARGKVKLFYELYNLQPGERITTEIALERGRNDVWSRIRGLFRDRQQVALAFQTDARSDSAGTVQEVRLLQPNLQPGAYRIVVRVTRVTGGQALRRELRFDLLR